MHIFFLHQHKEETDTQLFLALYSPIPSFLFSFPPSPILRVLSHTITKYQALPSPISCMLGELQLRPWNKDTPSAAVAASVYQLHLRYFRIWPVFQPMSFKWSNERKLLSRSGARWDLGENRGLHDTFVQLVNTETAWRHESCALTEAHEENVWWETAERSTPMAFHVWSHSPEFCTYIN